MLLQGLLTRGVVWKLERGSGNPWNVSLIRNYCISNKEFSKGDSNEYYN
jgi:hypothetical protein